MLPHEDSKVSKNSLINLQLRSLLGEQNNYENTVKSFQELRKIILKFKLDILIKPINLKICKFQRQFVKEATDKTTILVKIYLY